MPLLDRPAGALYFETAGAGEPVLFLAGLGFTASAWALQTAALSERCHVIAMDNRGSGRSVASEGPYTVAEMAQDAVDVLDHLEVATATVVGGSLGGLIAQVLAAEYPNRVNRLVLVTTTAGQDARGLRLLDDLERLAQVDGVAACLQHLLELGFSERYRTERAPMVEGLVKLATANAPTLHGFLGQIAALRTCNTVELLRKIQVPALVVAAEEDRVLPLEHSQALAEGLPNGVLVTVPGGHACAAEASETLTRTLADFILAEDTP